MTDYRSTFPVTFEYTPTEGDKFKRTVNVSYDIGQNHKDARTALKHLVATYGEETLLHYLTGAIRNQVSNYVVRLGNKHATDEDIQAAVEVMPLEIKRRGARLTGEQKAQREVNKLLGDGVTAEQLQALIQAALEQQQAAE